jgi:hypothetical protein
MRHVLAMMLQAIQKNSGAVIDALLEMLDSEWHVACLRSGVYVSALLYCCFTAARLKMARCLPAFRCVCTYVYLCVCIYVRMYVCISFSLTNA